VKLLGYPVVKLTRSVSRLIIWVGDVTDTCRSLLVAVVRVEVFILLSLVVVVLVGVSTTEAAGATG
jgi:hypothetical protein